MSIIDDEKIVLAIDCCEHIIAALESILDWNVRSVSSRGQDGGLQRSEVSLIAVCPSSLPIRRMFLSRLRRLHPETPMLIFHRKTQGSNERHLRGEFLLSDRRSPFDLDVVRKLRRILPMESCPHTRSNSDHDLVNEISRILAQNFSDPGLGLQQVAKELSVSPAKLSRLANREAHAGFRQMLRQIRIEEAKRLLASRVFSIKEVARRVGFSDSHYFSRTFKELTGLRPTEYEYDPRELIFD